MVICLRMGVVVDDFPRFPGILDGRCSSFWPWRNAMPCAKGVKKMWQMWYLDRKGP